MYLFSTFEIPDVLWWERHPRRGQVPLSLFAVTTKEFRPYGAKQIQNYENVRTMKTLYLGSDHAGFTLKEKLKRWLKGRNIPYKDLGDRKLDPKDDYPDYAAKVARKVARENTKGILVCGSAQGICIAANKIKGIRAVVPFSVKEATLSREHEDANVICLSGWFQDYNKSIRMLDAFLHTRFSGAVRHTRRLKKIQMLERR